MSNLSTWLSSLTLIALLITIGCGFAIHFGGEGFKSAITGHMVLGIITLIISLITLVTVIVSK